jgi:uncharacterized membrane protein
MPFILILVGLLLVIAGVNGQEAQLLSLVKADFTGSGSLKNSYGAWVLAIGVLGGLGYIKAIRPIANAFMGLVILVLFLSNRGFFAQFNAAFSSPNASAASSLLSNNSAAGNTSYNGISASPTSTSQQETQSILNLFANPTAATANATSAATQADDAAAASISNYNDLSSTTNYIGISQ